MLHYILVCEGGSRIPLSFNTVLHGSIQRWRWNPINLKKIGQATPYQFTIVCYVLNYKSAGGTGMSFKEVARRLHLTTLRNVLLFKRRVAFPTLPRKWLRHPISH